MSEDQDFIPIDALNNNNNQEPNEEHIGSEEELVESEDEIPRGNSKRAPKVTLSWCVHKKIIIPIELEAGDDEGTYDLEPLEELDLIKPSKRENCPVTILYGPNRAITPKNFDPEKEEAPTVSLEEVHWDFFVVGACDGHYVVIRLRDYAVFDSPSQAANEGYGPDFVEGPNAINPVSFAFYASFSNPLHRKKIEFPVLDSFVYQTEKALERCFVSGTTFPSIRRKESTRNPDVIHKIPTILSSFHLTPINARETQKESNQE
jgi:hypothetical protein